MPGWTGREMIGKGILGDGGLDGKVESLTRFHANQGSGPRLTRPAGTI